MFAFFKNKSRVNALAAARKKLKRKMGFTNFNDLKKVGIIIKYQLDIENRAINKLLEFFKGKGIHTEMLVYYPDKKLPANVKARLGMLYFAEGDTNWFGKPNKREVEEFINDDFGLLIDFSPEHIYSLQYIIQASKAVFKVGRISYNDDPYDFVLLGDKDDDIKYIDDLFKYLSKVQ